MFVINNLIDGFGAREHQFTIGCERDFGVAEIRGC